MTVVPEDHLPVSLLVSNEALGPWEALRTFTFLSFSQ